MAQFRLTASTFNSSAIAKFILFIIIFLTGNAAVASEKVEMADGLYQSGKIYVVVGVLAIIFIGIIIYLFQLDRKIEQIKKQQP